MKSTIRQNILNFVEASKFLTTIPELNSRYHLVFYQIGERPKHYYTQELARFDGETVTKKELLSALSEIEDDVDISIATHGDYDWGYSISMATDVETPYSDDDWLAEILKNYLYFGLNVNVDTMLMMRDNDVKSCADYESLIILVRTLYNFKFDIENNINLGEVISVQQIIIFKLLARLFE
jgi:hypothetical protein